MTGQRIRIPAADVDADLVEVKPVVARQRWRGSLYLVVWTLIGILFVGPFVVERATEQQTPPWDEVASYFFGWYLWGLLFPLIWWASRRWPFRRSTWPRWLVRNVVMGVAISLLYVALNLVKDAIIDGVIDGATMAHPISRASSHLWTGIWYYLLVYFAMVAVIHVITYSEGLREHELVASRLEGQLAQANLRMLKMQLHPHFLFNTLNAVSSLMHSNVDAADRMISQLSDLLRMALEKDDRHQIRLEKELDFLNRYLAIEQIRFRDRLKVEIDVDPSCLSAQVPRLILQPLVENAIRHGIAMRSAAGRVAIRATQDGSYLRMMVADDGPGLAPNRSLRPGVGLANTRDRLEQLYGGDHTLELVNAESGGFEVHVGIPFEIRPRLAAQLGG